MTDTFPATPTAADLDALISEAVHAPSVLNTQPWRFVVDGNALLLYADRSRQLTALDPSGREMTISCGAALTYLRIAARHTGWNPTVFPFPVKSEPDLLAGVTFEPATRPRGDDRLFRALALRRTNRQPFSGTPVPASVMAEVVEAVSNEGSLLHVLTSQTKKDALASLVAAGIINQGENPEIVAEIGAWLRPPRDPRPDGVRDSAQGVWDRRAALRTPPSSVAAYKGRLIQEAPAVLILSTVVDEPTEWLAAGQALSRALVVAADRGLAASYANEPVEVDSLRWRIAGLTAGGVPQVVFRLGYPEAAPSTPRRFARDVTEHRLSDAPPDRPTA